MGYVKKAGTTCNPAKKSGTVFQNSYTERVLDHYTSVVDHYENRWVTVGTRGAGDVRRRDTAINHFELYVSGMQSGDHVTGSLTVGGTRQVIYQGDVPWQTTINVDRYADAYGAVIYSETGASGTSYNVLAANLTIQRYQSVPIYRNDPVYRNDTKWNTKWSKRGA